MKDLLIYGCGYSGIVNQIKYKNSESPEWNITGFIDDGISTKETFMGYPIVGGEEVIPEYVKKGYFFLNNIASTTDIIETISVRLSKYNANRCTLIIPTTPHIDKRTVKIGKGSLISSNVTVDTNAKIGRHVVVRQNVLVGHDSVVGDYCFIGPNATLLGKVQVGDKTFIGAGAVIKDRVSIGRNCMIGMGAVIIRDVPDNTKMYGSPAKKLNI